MWIAHVWLQYFVFFTLLFLSMVFFTCLCTLFDLYCVLLSIKRFGGSKMESRHFFARFFLRLLLLQKFFCYMKFVWDKNIVDFMDFSLRLNHRCLPFYYVENNRVRVRERDRQTEIKVKCPVHMSGDCVKTCKRFISRIYVYLLLFYFVHFFRLYFFSFSLFFPFYSIFDCYYCKRKKNSLSTY